MDVLLLLLLGGRPGCHKRLIVSNLEARGVECLHLPKLLMKCKCLGEFDIIGPQKLARVLRKRHAMAHTRHTPTAFQSHERRRCQNPLGDSNGDEPRLPCAPERLADLKF